MFPRWAIVCFAASTIGIQLMTLFLVGFVARSVRPGLDVGFVYIAGFLVVGPLLAAAAVGAASEEVTPRPNG